MDDPRFTQLIADKFWSRVDVRGPDECWLWTGTTVRSGYGFLRVTPTCRMHAHRWAYQYMTDKVLPRHIRVDHRFHCHVACDPRCCNPAHLREATQKQNQENRAGAQVNSKTGVRGVYWHKASQRYYGQVKHHQKKIHVGAFSNIEDAERAVIAKRRELFTHNEADLHCTTPV